MLLCKVWKFYYLHFIDEHKGTEEPNDTAKVTHTVCDLGDILKDLSSVVSAAEAEDATYTPGFSTLGNLVVSREKQTLPGHNSPHSKVKPRAVQMNHVMKEPV